MRNRARTYMCCRNSLRQPTSWRAVVRLLSQERGGRRRDIRQRVFVFGSYAFGLQDLGTGCPAVGPILRSKAGLSVISLFGER